MPPRQKRRRRSSNKHVNVFVQENAPKGREEIEDDDVAMGAVAGDEAAEVAPGTKPVSVSRTRRLRAQRVARQTRARSEVFTRSIGKELRKLGVLSGGIVVILVVLSFVL